jgi:ubiquinone/menaquinone biosynthesis C-methylase UbiE
MSVLLKALSTGLVYRLAAGRVVLPWAMQGMRPSGQALEIGGGSGAMAARLLTRFPALRLTVTDYDPDMVARTRQRLARFGERAVVRQADAATLPFQDGEFDAVFSFGMLHHVVDWESAIGEAIRVLRPAGRFVGYDVLDTAPVQWAHRVSEPGQIRAVRSGPLATVLARLPVTDIRTRRSAGGLLVRFAATKTT